MRLVNLIQGNRLTAEQLQFRTQKLMSNSVAAIQDYSTKKMKFEHPDALLAAADRPSNIILFCLVSCLAMRLHFFDYIYIFVLRLLYLC